MGPYLGSSPTSRIRELPGWGLGKRSWSPEGEIGLRGITVPQARWRLSLSKWHLDAADKEPSDRGLCGPQMRHQLWGLPRAADL